MANFHFVKRGNVFNVASDHVSENLPKLPGGIYSVKFHPMGGFWLESMDDFVLPAKLYGSHAADAERILSTFAARPKTTGVLLSGEKGSGKTMLAKLVSKTAKERGIPTLVVNQPYAGDAFNDFLASIVQPSILLFDEFEKVYSAEQQQSILTLMDGVFENQKMFVLTCNAISKIDAHMQNRPGRLFYHLDYEGLDQNFIAEYCNDRLENKEHTPAVCALATMFWRFNFDMLQAIVEEMNRYNETPAEALRLLNCKPEKTFNTDFKIILKIKGHRIEEDDLEDDGDWSGHPMNGNLRIGFKVQTGKDENDNDSYEWKNASFTPADMIHMNGQKGQYVFRNQGGAELALTKVVHKTYGYRDAISNVSTLASAYEFPDDFPSGGPVF